MFTRKEKNMLFDPYFEVIRETEQFIEVRSVNTGHCWSVFKNIYNAPRKITLYHKHKESDRYFHQHRVYRTVVDAVSEIKSHDKYVLEEKTKQRESPAQTERRLKVHESSGYKYKPTPSILLKGDWLRQVGFNSGDQISVKCENGKLTITTVLDATKETFV